VTPIAARGINAAGPEELRETGSGQTAATLDPAKVGTAINPSLDIVALACRELGLAEGHLATGGPGPLTGTDFLLKVSGGTQGI
jgi:hypothetical protein